MNIQTVKLGFILKQIPDYDFSMDKFDDRLKLQKTVYLLQIFGIYLGYDFSWYLRGPYCSLLSANGLELEKSHEFIPKQDVAFEKKETQKMFKEFLKFIENKTIDELEIIASLHYLKEINDLSEEYSKERVGNKSKKFETEQVNKGWKELQNLLSILDKHKIQLNTKSELNSKENTHNIIDKTFGIMIEDFENEDTKLELKDPTFSFKTPMEKINVNDSTIFDIIHKSLSVTRNYV